MMTRQEGSLREAVATWLRLDALEGETQTVTDVTAAAAETQLERALAKVFSSLPVAVPSAGFVDRVMHEVTWEVPERVAWFGHWGIRAAVAFLLMQAGLLIGLVPTAWSLVDNTVGIAAAISALVTTAVDGLRMLERGLDATGPLLEAARTLSSAAATPVVVGALALVTLVPVLALRLMLHLSSPPRVEDAGRGR